MKEYVSKDAETRAKEILAAARQLFIQKGYESTSIDDIAAQVGVTKGSFYHNFKSKAAVLEAVVDQLSAGVIAIVRETAARGDLNALEKINLIVAQTYTYRADRRVEYTSLASSPPMRGSSADALPQGRMRKRLFEKVLQAVLDPYTAIIRQGISEGVFDVDYPEEAARFYVRVADLLRDELILLAAASSREDAFQKVKFYEQALERVLAAPTGSLKLVDPVMDFFFSGQTGEGDAVRD